MAGNGLSDDLFYNAYQKDPHIKGLVDNIQKLNKGHSSQKNQSDYDPTTWYEKAKKDPAVVNAVREYIAKQKEGGGLEAKVTELSKSPVTSFIEGIGKIFSYEKFGPVATAATAGLLLYLGMPIY